MLHRLIDRCKWKYLRNIAHKVKKDKCHLSLWALAFRLRARLCSSFYAEKSGDCEN